MKIRYGFVSNSSSGSFIFPKSMTCDDIDQKLSMLIEFANKIEQTDKYTFESIFGCSFPMDEVYIRTISNELPESEEIGKKGLVEKYNGLCVVTTSGDNSVPFWIHNLLCDKLGALYIHRGG